MCRARHCDRAKRLPVGVAAVLLSIAAVWPQSAAAVDKDEFLPPKEVTLKTSDDVTLVATYYPSKLGNKAVPVILLHAGKGNRGELEALAVKLQHAGHAVIVPDLRGHGDSARSADRATELRAADCLAMVEDDLEAVKRFLMAQNNAGELNIEKLCVVGIEMGAVVALNWAARDWSWPVLATGKQGQDVKALVLISPEWSFKGLKINDALAQQNIRADVSMMIIAGKGNNKSLQEARRLYNALEKYHAAAGDDPAKKTLWLNTPQTSLQGTRLLNEKRMGLDATILKFIDLRLVKQPIAWTERKNPFD